MTVQQKLIAWLEWSFIVGFVSYAIAGCQSIPADVIHSIDKGGRSIVEDISTNHPVQ